MPKYLLRRFAEMLITLFLIATATFFLLEAVPGDPLTERASKLSPTVKENLYKRYGLDKIANLNVCTVFCSKRQGTVQHEFHVSGSGSLFGCQGDLLGDICCRDHLCSF